MQVLRETILYYLLCTGIEIKPQSIKLLLIEVQVAREAAKAEMLRPPSPQTCPQALPKEYHSIPKTAVTVMLEFPACSTLECNNAVLFLRG